MRRALIAMSVAGALLVASCGSSTGEGVATGGADQATGGAGSSTTAAPAVPSGPPAPDFTLSLGEDGATSFTLSQEAKPVYMVFWAEW